ncbi:MAG: 3-deoxy-manno-octulosonate cytidylyltransferase, partial [Verrucomicrobiia bacterium]
MRAVAIIPARFHSTRFPGKILHPIAGQPLLQWVYQGVA